MIYQTWDIWWADVRYEDSPAESKRRPVIILNKKAATVMALKATSRPKKENEPFEYELIDWKAANLPKPTTVLIRSILSLEHNELITRIGRISLSDALAIQKLSKRMRSEI